MKEKMFSFFEFNYAFLTFAIVITSFKTPNFIQKFRESKH